MRNLQLNFDWHYIGQKYYLKGEDFTKFCGLLRIYELYRLLHKIYVRRFFFNDVTFLQLKNSNFEVCNFSGFHLAQKLLFVRGHT